jgi:DNA processing protein
MSALPAAAWLLALAELPGMGPARLLALHRAHGAAGAWARVAAGEVADSPPEVLATLGPRPAELLAGWESAARRADPASTWARHQVPGVAVDALGDPGYPAALADDVDPPAVVVRTGDDAALDGPRVAVVGTRRCTRTGREVARELGAGLAAAGVRVVSGLAAGVDGAAHRGALDAGGAPPVAVVGSGLDVPYPQGHAELWRQVAGRGLVLSEAPLGTRPAPWRFPARNRVIAALADVVVVVESHAGGGALHTVDEAARRSRPVLAVPGSVRNPAAAGTNRLLFDGCGPARDVGDVLVALGLDRPDGHAERRRRPTPSPTAAQALAAIGWDPVPVDAVAVAAGLGPGAVSLALEELDAGGWIHRQGGYVERRGRR